MTRALTILFALSALPSPAAAEAPALQGDAARGQALYRLHCASCHGTSGSGGGPLARSMGEPAPTALADTAFLMQRTDEQLHAAIAKGGPAVGKRFTMPAFGPSVGSLGAWDLVAFLRRDQPRVDEFFPDAARFTARAYEIDADGQKRLAPVVPDASPAELKVPVASVFGGDKGADGPEFVAQDPRFLDTLKPKQKIGYLAFLAVPVPGVASPVPMTLALDKEGVLVAIRPAAGAIPEKERARIEKLLSSFIGQGGKRAAYQPFKAPKASGKDAKVAQDLAKSLTRAYYLGLEGAVMFDKEERERHWAD